MNSPREEAARATEIIMKTVRAKHPDMSDAEFEAKGAEIFQACLKRITPVPRALPIREAPANERGIFTELPSKVVMLAAQPFQYHHRERYKAPPPPAHHVDMSE